MKNNIRTRFAPSPTGFMHIGNLRSALYEYLFARHNDGKFILRVEDTDQTRKVEDGLECIIRTLDAVGIDYDEGPTLEDDDKVAEKGNFGPYIQSKRLDIYKEHATKLIENDKAYYCFCSSERLTQLRERQRAAKQPTKYDRTCCELVKDEVQKRLDAGEPHVIRLKVPEGKTIFKDVVRGTVEFNNTEVDDQVLMKSDGFPTYHLAVVVDDHLMEINHVIRGEDWLSSTPKHIMLYDAFGWEKPEFAHLPLLLNSDKSKLSKRQGDVAVEDYLAKGYLPEALINFVALLGFNPRADQEVYSLDELIKEFDLTKINKGGAVFNTEKLDWLNGHYIREIKVATLTDKLIPFWQSAGIKTDKEDRKFQEKVAALEQTRIKHLDEVGEGKFYFEKPDYDAELLIWKKSDRQATKENLNNLLEFLSKLKDNTFEDIEKLEKEIRTFIESNKLDNGSILWPLRVALSGQKASPGPFELANLFEKVETINRIEGAISRL